MTIDLLNRKNQKMLKNSNRSTQSCPPTSLATAWEDPCCVAIVSKSLAASANSWTGPDPTPVRLDIKNTKWNPAGMETESSHMLSWNNHVETPTYHVLFGPHWFVCFKSILRHGVGWAIYDWLKLSVSKSKSRFWKTPQTNHNHHGYEDDPNNTQKN